jgi:hypothetical protein
MGHPSLPEGYVGNGDVGHPPTDQPKGTSVLGGRASVSGQSTVLQ